MIEIFESTVRTNADQAFFTFIDAGGIETDFSYRETRLISAALARRLMGHGVQAGSFVMVDLPNCAEFVFLMLAAAYGNFTLVTLNNRLTTSEKLSRSLELERVGNRIAYHIDGDTIRGLMDSVYDELEGRQRYHAIFGAQQDAIEENLHFAERSARLFDPTQCAVVMFTSGTTGKSKAVPLTWVNLMESAKASNLVLNEQGQGLWQAVLPFYHIGGLQVLVRSVCNRTPFRLYAKFEPRRVLSDAIRYGVTHISVVDKMLHDLLIADVKGAVSTYLCILLGGGPLNGQTIRRALDARARVYASYGMTETSSQIANSRVNSQFRGGMKLLPGYEAHIVDPGEDGFGKLAVRGPGLFEDYLNAHGAFTVDGFFMTGDTAAFYQDEIFVRERTEDMFISGGENVYPAEIANVLRRVPSIADAHVFGVVDETWGKRPVAIVERQAAMPVDLQSLRQFLSTKLSRIYQPEHICIVDVLPRSGIGKIDRRATERMYEDRLDVRKVELFHIRIPFSHPFKTAKATLTHRDSIIVKVTDYAGRSGLGECVSFATDWYLPETLGQDAKLIHDLLAPQVLSEAYLHPRDVSSAFAHFKEAVDYPIACSSLETALWDLYGKIVEKPLWQLLNDEYALFNSRGARRVLGAPSVSGPMQRVTVEGTNLWQQHFSTRESASTLGSAPRITGSFGVGSGSYAGASGSAAIGNRPSGSPDVSRTHEAAESPHGNQSVAVEAGAVVGIGTPEAVVTQVKNCLQAGYRRIKLKISPDQGIECVRAVRAVFPELLITLDANQSFDDKDIDTLIALDELHVGFLEEPLAVREDDDAFVRLARLQRHIATPLCVDESFTNALEAEYALSFAELRCFVVKVGKFGGVEPALSFIRRAQGLGREVWMGGMYDTGISRRLHAAFQTLPGVIIPGDIGSVSRYFPVDITEPPYVAQQGQIILNENDEPFGLGCRLNEEALQEVLVNKITIE